MILFKSNLMQLQVYFHAVRVHLVKWFLSLIPFCSMYVL